MPAVPLYQIDAFTSRPFGGNPAAVMPLDTWLDTTVMQAIAAENNLAETVFFVPTPGAQSDFHIRWFTPAVEVPLCGHATLAAAFVLYERLGWTQTAIRFSSEKAGVLAVSREAGRIVLDFPSLPPKPVVLSAPVAKAMGAAPRATLRHGDYWLLHYADEAAVAALDPDFRALKATGAEVIATAAASEASVDFVSRFFAPSAGVDEDPVTGSAHCRLIPYWAKVLGKSAMFARQISRRGGELWCTLQGDRVLMAGHCVETVRGQFILPD